jgi:predicted nucleic-acid-binding protein
VRITADTNRLVRATVAPDARFAAEDTDQAQRACATLSEASVVAVPVAALCEFAWVLGRVYGFGRAEIAGAIRRLVGSAPVVCDAPAVETGLAVLEAGGDFADGAIAASGARLGGDTFVSFDPQAIQLLSRAGWPARLVGEDEA